MDIPFDHFSGRLIGLSIPANTIICPAPLDWPGLAARLAAAHAARQILARLPALGNGASGSFAPAVARDLAGWRAAASSSPGVNLDAKADGKPTRTIGRSDAGDDRPIVRGLI